MVIVCPIDDIDIEDLFEEICSSTGVDIYTLRDNYCTIANTPSTEGTDSFIQELEIMERKFRVEAKELLLSRKENSWANNNKVLWKTPLQGRIVKRPINSPIPGRNY